MDDRLRALERAARADPSDRVAGRALVQAFDQAGDEVGAWRARCRLARGGDEDAWRALTALPAGARAPGEAIERVFDGAYSAEADPRTVLLAGPTLEALDAATLAPRWSISGAQGHSLLVGPYVVHAPAEASEVVLRLARTGEEVARVAAPGPVTALHATLDRLIVTCEQGQESRSVIVDLGEVPGATLAVRVDRPPYQSTVAAGRGLRVVVKHESVAAVYEARGVDDDVVRWPTHQLRWISDSGLVADSGHDLTEISELDPSTSLCRWTYGSRSTPVAAALAGDVVVLALARSANDLSPGRMHLTALDRRDGAPRWECPELEFTLYLLCVSRNAVYLLGWEDREEAAHIECREVASGRKTWRVPVLTSPLVDPSWVPPLHAVDHGVVLVKGEGGLTRLLRLGAP
ncbi:MAG: hypothetical protein M9894_30135 [Planctomycetes bacterium]|nr:hypothetical protein [Planctomycetota bacterium]